MERPGFHCWGRLRYPDYHNIRTRGIHLVAIHTCRKFGLQESYKVGIRDGYILRLSGEKAGKEKKNKLQQVAAVSIEGLHRMLFYGKLSAKILTNKAMAK